LTAEKVEKKLQDSFALAQAWDCVLLLDEADVFLGESTSLQYSPTNLADELKQPSDL